MRAGPFTRVEKPATISLWAWNSKGPIRCLTSPLNTSPWRRWWPHCVPPTLDCLRIAWWVIAILRPAVKPTLARHSIGRMRAAWSSPQRTANPYVGRRPSPQVSSRREMDHVFHRENSGPNRADFPDIADTSQVAEPYVVTWRAIDSLVRGPSHRAQAACGHLGTSDRRLRRGDDRAHCDESAAFARRLAVECRTRCPGHRRGHDRGAAAGPNPGGATGHEWAARRVAGERRGSPVAERP